MLMFPDVRNRRRPGSSDQLTRYFYLEQLKGDTLFDFAQRIPCLPHVSSFGPSRANVGVGKVDRQERQLSEGTVDPDGCGNWQVGRALHPHQPLY